MADPILDINSAGEEIDKAVFMKHEHKYLGTGTNNLSTLNKFGESAGQPTFCGNPIHGKQGEPGIDGKDGEPGKDGRDGVDGLPGADGQDGIDGRDGKSPYIGANGNWFEFNDTTQAFFDTGKRAQGQDGVPGIDGADGADGAPGEAAIISSAAATTLSPESPATVSMGGTPQNRTFLFGIPRGADGADGGGESDIAWLPNVTLDGDLSFTRSSTTTPPEVVNIMGADGRDGQPGTQGERGEDGLSAYEIWLAEGNVGTEQDFLDSLIGEQGEPGIRYDYPLSEADVEQDAARRAWENAEINIEYWTGGKKRGDKLYGKIIDCGNLPNNASKLVPHNIANIKKTWSIKGIANSSSGIADQIIPHVNTGGATYQTQVSRDGANIFLRTASDFSPYSGFVTLKYTCTDR